MPVGRLLLRLRTTVAITGAIALFAATVAWSVSHPNGAAQKIILGIADAPRFVVDTVTNVVSDRFALSRTPDEFSQLHIYRAIPNHSTYQIEGLVMRTGSSAPPQPGWRILYGIFRIDGEPRYAALALSPALAIEHVWMISGKVAGDTVTPFEPAPYPHGFALLHDGSIVAGFDTNYRTVRIGACGHLVWQSSAHLNHAISAVEGDRFAWGVGDHDSIQKIDLRTGALVRTISMDALRRANPDVSALDMLRIDDNDLGENSRLFDGRSHADPYHLNDAEPLPPGLAARYPQFRAGDLLLSFRSLNLLAVVDPATLRIKWHTHDNLFRQHDPDWGTDGQISVLDNQMGRGSTDGAFSRIVGFDPATGHHHILLNGQPLNFYTRIRGKHQRLDNGGILITSSGQGRVLETDRDGTITLEMLNRDLRSPGKNFLISETLLLPANTPLFEKIRTCPRQ